MAKHNLDVRPEVAYFALWMEKKLKANDHKPGWKQDDPADLLRRVYEETNELEQLLASGESALDNIMDEAADVANMAMMIWDIAWEARFMRNKLTIYDIYEERGA